MSVLITGGTGFLGSRLAEVLTNQGQSVVLLDVHPSLRFFRNGTRGMHVVKGDVANFSDVLSVIKKHRTEVVYHAGALLSGQAEAHPATAFWTNLVGTFHVLEASRILEVPRVILTSTVATFGPGVSLPVSNEATQKPTTMYGVTKVGCERLGEYYAGRYGIDFRGLRLPSVVGAGRGQGGLSAYSNLMMEETARGRSCTVQVAEHSRMPILYVKDAVRALYELEQADKDTLGCSMYNIAGLSPTAGEIAAALRTHAPEAHIEFRPDPLVQQVVDSWPAELDDKQARSEWGWHLEFDLDELIVDFLDEVRGATHEQ
jgi:threonine 3-dehydrogenase